MAMQLADKRAFDPPSIPDRLYFKIGDVARICDVETYVLRFWETQFPQLKPNKSGTGQRLYRRRDVELALEIKRLVHAEGYTLSGARQAMESGHKQSQSQRRQEPSRDSLREPQLAAPVVPAPVAIADPQRKESVASAIGQARAELREIAGLLASPVARPLRRRPRLAAVPNPSESLFPL